MRLVAVTVAISLLGAGSGVALAQAKVTDKPAAPAAAKVSGEQMAAATEMLLAMQFDKTIGPTIESVLDMQIRAQPSNAPYRKVMLEFLNKYMGWESIKDSLATAYAEEFTVAELKELTAFYKTPIGQKAALRLPKLAAKGGEIGMKMVQAHLPELQEMISKAMTESKPK
jgi:hypothetical protein